MNDNVCVETGVHKNYCTCLKHVTGSKPYKKKWIKQLKMFKPAYSICGNCGLRRKIYFDKMCRKCYYNFLNRKHFGRREVKE